MSDFRRRLRGTIRNAVIWGAGWGVLGFATTMVLRMTGFVDAPVSVLDAVGIGVRVGFVGGIAGAAFSAFIAFAYRNRRIQDISWLKFGLGGALVTTIGMTALMQGGNLLSGDGLAPWRLINGDIAMFAIFGFGAAALSMKLAQMATSDASSNDEVLPRETRSPEQLNAGEPASPLHQRARETERAE